MPGSSNGQTELTTSVLFLESYRKWFYYSKELSREDKQECFHPDHHPYQLSLLPGISIIGISSIKKGAKKYIEVSINRETLPPACKAGQDTLLQAIHILQSLSELSDNSNVKKKNAEAIRYALIRYLRPPDRMDHFSKFLRKYCVPIIIVVSILSLFTLPPIVEGVFLLLLVGGMVTAIFHHLFSWKHINNGHETLVRIIDEAYKQLPPALKASHSVQAQSSSPSQLNTAYFKKTKIVDYVSGANCANASTSTLFNQVKKEEKTVQEGQFQAFSTRR